MNLSRPLVSVILPVFNRRHLIQRAIASVQNQTLDDWELLIVDDGSSDGVEHDILPRVLKTPNLRYMKHAQRKLSASRNIGMYAALGRFITFLDSDDEYTVDHLALRVKYFREHPDVDVIHGGVQFIGPEESHYVVDAFDATKKIHLSECCIGATFFGKKSVFLKTGGFKEMPYSAESEFLPRLSNQAVVKKVEFPTYRYYTGLDDSICAQRNKDHNMNGIK